MSRLPSSMMGGRRSRQQPTQPEIIETNPMRDVRTIYWSCRWLDGWVGAYVQTNWKLNDTLGLSNIGNPAEPQMHWALRIGSYLYELLTDENMNIRWRYVDEARFESWTSAIPDRAVGETSATDTELAFMAQEVISRMECNYTSPTSPKAKYNFVKNNCHTFVLGLLNDMICCEIQAPCMSESPAFAGWKKMELMSSQHNVSTLMGSPKKYVQGIADMYRGKLQERHFGTSLPEYQRGAVMEEKFRREELVLGN